MFDSSDRVIQSLKKIARKEILKNHILESEGFRSLRNSVSGEPVPVYSPSGTPEFWIVPYVSGAKSTGFAFFDKNQKLIRVGVFSPGSKDVSGTVDVSYFTQPPSEIINDIAAKFAGYSLSKPVFSYDGTPAKWSWRLELVKGNEEARLVYILPGSWYEVKGEKAPDMEG